MRYDPDQWPCKDGPVEYWAWPAWPWPSNSNNPVEPTDETHPSPDGDSLA